MRTLVVFVFFLFQTWLCCAQQSTDLIDSTRVLKIDSFRVHFEIDVFGPNTIKGFGTTCRILENDSLEIENLDSMWGIYGTIGYITGPVLPANHIQIVWYSPNREYINMDIYRNAIVISNSMDRPGNRYIYYYLKITTRQYLNIQKLFNEKTPKSVYRSTDEWRLNYDGSGIKNYQGLNENATDTAEIISIYHKGIVYLYKDLNRLMDKQSRLRIPKSSDIHIRDGMIITSNTIHSLPQK